MPRKNKEDFTTISIKKTDYKKLKKYRVPKSRPYWIIINDILNGKIKIEE